MADKTNRTRRNASLRRSAASRRTSLKMGLHNNELGLRNQEYKDNERVSVKRAKKIKKVSKADFSNDFSSYERESYTRDFAKNADNYRASSVTRKNKNKKSRRNSGDGAKQFAIGIFIIILIYVGVIGYKFVTRDVIPYGSVIYGSIDTPKTATGIIIRDEKVYTAPSAGSIRFNVADLEKIRKGELICSIRDEAVVASMEDELEDINKSILAIQDTRDNLSTFSEDIKRINTQIKDIVDENVFSIATGDIDKIYYIKDNVKNKIDSKNQMLLSEGGGSLQELANKKVERENEINKNTSSVSALDGGVISYSFDGLEESLKVENLDAITEEQTLMKQEDNSTKQAIGQVNANDGVFKIVKSNDWYIASYIENAYIDGWQEGDYKILYIKGDGESIPIESQIFKISQSDKKTYVVFKVTKDILDFINARSVTFEINKVKEGFKINNNAIVEVHTLKIPSSFVNEDGIVLKKSQNSTINIAVATSGSDETGQFVYVPVEYGSLNAQDEIINPDNSEDIYKITDVSTSKGIYVINTGVTEFKKINLENSVQNSTHTILDPNLNVNIKVYDRIVTDVKNIEKEQKIY